MSDMHEKKRKYDSALDYYKMAMAVNDSIFNKDKVAKFNELQIRYNLEKKEQENELLRKNMEIQSLQMRRDRQYQTGLITGLVIILFVSFYISYQSNKLRKTNTILEKQNNEILKINKEKELILKEVHHRIKNNMNTMKSLLALQSKSMSEPTAVSALTDAKNRLHSMGLLYDKLYRYPDTQNLSIPDYFEPLIDEIVSVFPHGDKVRVEKKLDDIMLDVKTLSALGIIVTELITNAMKYAFTDGQQGVIRVVLGKNETDLKLEVKNSGKMLPHDFKIENTEGFGLKLVSMLVQQIKGKIFVENQTETCFTIYFPHNTA
jgi:two-component sensor histidine kinase